MKFENQPWKQDEPKPAVAAHSDGIPAAWIVGVVARAVGSAFVGAILFAFFLGAFLQGPLGLGDWAESRWNWALVGAGLGALLGIGRGLWDVARRLKTRRLASTLSLHYADAGEQHVAERLKSLLVTEGFVSLENVMVGEHDGARLLVGDLVVVRHGSESNSRQKRTVAFFEDLPVSFPRFCLQPEGKLLNVLSELVGVEDIDFDGHEEFSRNYHLSGDSPQTIRQLFQPPLLDHLVQLPPREIRAEKDCLAVVTTRGSLGPNELEAFVEESNGLRHQFEAASGQVSEMVPPPAHEDRPAASGLLGRFVRQAQVSDDEVQQFLSLPTPREVPRQILFQHLNGSAWFLILFFGLFAAMGALFAGIGVVAGEWLIGLLGGLFAAIGLTVLAVTMWRRSAKFHLLREGQLASGRIEEVRRTNVAVNNQQRYLATVSYIAEGRPRSTTLALYGAHVELAREAAEAERDVPLLFDPRNPARIVLALQLQSAVAVRI